MKRVVQPGKVISRSQRRQLEVQAKMRACVSPLIQATGDFSKLRDTLNSRMFVGPPKPVHCYEMPQDQASINYWRLADQFDRFGYQEVCQTGTPSIAEWMGF